VVLNDEQERAVAVALRSAFTVVTGGPGTGKTSLVVALLRAAARIGIAPEAMALAAPTGKAAQRLDDAVRAALRRIPSRGARPQLDLFARAPATVDERLLSDLPKPETLHRLLGYSPSDGRFRTHERAPLAAKLVVVDEGSMMDSELLDRVVRAVPKDARLVLLGDADQLPSIDAGAVFRDLVEVGEARGFCVRLERSYRMNPDDPAGAAIYRAAQAFRAGAVPAIPPAAPLVDDRATFAFAGVEALEGPPGAVLGPFTRAWFAARVQGDDDHRARLERGYEWTPGEPFGPDDALVVREVLRHYESARVLTFTRDDGRSTSSKSLNGVLGELLRAAVDPRATVGTLCAGTPVMMLKNDYERGLFNGDQGVVLQRARGRGLVAVFPRGESLVGFPLDGLLGDVTAAFAMTVHKSQGSEYAHVGLVLPEDDGPLVTRELLYTAVTRASRSVTLVGARSLLEAAALRPAARSTGLASALRARG
jgi:exodeoxyribonuclease V alpha subunit